MKLEEEEEEEEGDNDIASACIWLPSLSFQGTHVFLRFQPWITCPVSMHHRFGRHFSAQPHACCIQVFCLMILLLRASWCHISARNPAFSQVPTFDLSASHLSCKNATSIWQKFLSTTIPCTQLPSLLLPICHTHAKKW